MPVNAKDTAGISQAAGTQHDCNRLLGVGLVGKVLGRQNQLDRSAVRGEVSQVVTREAGVLDRRELGVVGRFDGGREVTRDDVEKLFSAIDLRCDESS